MKTQIVSIEPLDFLKKDRVDKRGGEIIECICGNHYYHSRICKTHNRYIKIKKYWDKKGGRGKLYYYYKKKVRIK